MKPKKGSAVLFYNLLEDGNGDDLALHAALPVRSGEKWLANFWVSPPPPFFSRYSVQGMFSKTLFLLISYVGLGPETKIKLKIN